MERKIKNPMGYEEILPLLVKMSIPVMLSMLIQSLYNIVDSYFVSKISEKSLRATSLSYPLQIIIVGVAVGTGVGINSFISRSLGSDREDVANQGAMHGLLLTLVCWALFLVFRFTMMEGFFNLFTTDLEVKAMGMDYLGLVTSFSIFAITQIIIEKTIQGTGNMVVPMIIQIIGAVINIILDPIMIFGYFGFPRMGIRGAAIATLIGQGFGAFFGLYFLLMKKTDLRINFKDFKLSRDIIKNIYRVGFPSILMNTVTAIVTTLMNLILAARSEMAVSVLGIYFKLESFVMMPSFGLSQGVLPIIGYNFGARNKERIKEAYRYGIRLNLGLMALGTLIFQLFPRQLIGIFTEDPAMIEMGVYTLRIISLGFILAAIGIINAVYFQAIGKGDYSLIVTSLRQLVIIVPVAYLLSFIGVNFVWAAYPIAEVISTTVSIILQRKATRQYVDIF